MWDYHLTRYLKSSGQYRGFSGQTDNSNCISIVRLFLNYKLRHFVKTTLFRTKVFVSGFYSTTYLMEEKQNLLEKV